MLDKFEIVGGILKKKGWKVTQDLEALGQETVAAMIANAEGVSLAKAKNKLTKASEEYVKNPSQLTR